ncbi:unnamed protein product [Adineta steineri]|uniref:HAT C-terminal dimerisation domain-containing protein n=1 Tax=Adineta steineri TaxID=433720 RepID=A0A819UCU2_9BILA|nr:unnamed protein product [Adineta steineri]
MKPKIQSATNDVPQRELRSKTKSTISFQTQNSPQNTNHRSVRDRAKSTTGSPTLGRKILKAGSRRNSSQISITSSQISVTSSQISVNSSQISVNSSTMNEPIALYQDNDNNQSDESNGTMDSDLTEEITTSSSVTNEIIADPDSVNMDVATNEIENDPLNESTETVYKETLKRTTTNTKKDVFKYFTKQLDGGFKCNICINSDKVFSKTNEYSDTNLRSHLGKMHRMKDFLYPSQRIQYKPKYSTISAEEKKILDTAAIEAIIQDILPFNHFRKAGMMKFLSIIKPGYRGPHRKTVRKHLELLYQQKRKLIKKHLSSISNVSLTADVWKNSTDDYFICLTCHYFTESLENKSLVLSFRRFPDKHSAQKFRSFIYNELKKMDLLDKIQSITTDGGPDIKSATQGGEFGMRISCTVHNLNLVVKKALWLFDKTPSNLAKMEFLGYSSDFSAKELRLKFISHTVSSSAATVPEENDNYVHYDDNDYEDYEDYDNHDDNETSTTDDNETSTIDDSEISIIDDNEVSKQGVDENDYDSDVSDEYNSNNNSTSTSISSDEDLFDETCPDVYENEKEQASLQGDETNQSVVDERTPSAPIANTDILASTIFNLLKRVRNLVGFIRKSSVLNRYVRHQIYLKQVEINRRAKEEKKKPIKLKRLIIDFRIRWNTTFVMISRFISTSTIITDITFSPDHKMGLRKEQYQKLQNMSFSREDWSHLVALKFVLRPFYEATILLSGSKYPTLSITFHILKGLKLFLLSSKTDEPLQNSMKQLLFIKFKYYFESQMTGEQKRATMIAAFLNPATYLVLHDDELSEAEQLVLSEFDINQSMKKLQINNFTTTTTTPTNVIHLSTSANKKSLGTTSLNKFLRACEISLPSNSTTTTVNKKLSFKEELRHYMATAHLSSNFAEYWLQKEEILPQLLQFAKRYNCIPTSSVPSESAFSLAGHVHRKARSSLSSTAIRYSMVLHE